VSGVAGDLQGPEEYQLAACTNFPITSNCVELTLLRSRFDAMTAISSQILLLVSKSRVSFVVTLDDDFGGLLDRLSHTISVRHLI
jgi:hypothetical protein